VNTVVECREGYSIDWCNMVLRLMFFVVVVFGTGYCSEGAFCLTFASISCWDIAPKCVITGRSVSDRQREKCTQHWTGGGSIQKYDEATTAHIVSKITKKGNNTRSEAIFCSPLAHTYLSSNQINHPNRSGSSGNLILHLRITLT
jgi:hypothetical protein